MVSWWIKDLAYLLPVLATTHVHECPLSIVVRIKDLAYLLSLLATICA
jgi:hypothetical protein